MKTQPCAQKQKTISRADLPLCCPPLSERLWDAHPRVYLEMDKTGFVVCPYCETQYRVK